MGLGIQVRREGSRRAAVGPCEDRERPVSTVKDGGERSRAICPMSWAPIMICHGLSMSALTPGLPGTDRGRQSANPRIFGGLVSHFRGGFSGRVSIWAVAVRVEGEKVPVDTEE